MTAFALILGTIATPIPVSVEAAEPTPVGGILTGEHHWTADGSPYTLVDNVTLANGAVLTIDPGVTVVASTALKVNVAGG